MTREEAQFILAAYRPSNEDAHDPQFQDALALTRQDPVLSRWFAAQQALDRAFSAKLRSCAPPPELRMQLLLALTTVRRVPWWRRPGTIALAACVAVIVCLGTGRFTRQRDDTFLAFRQAMVQASLDKADHTDVAGLDAVGYKRWIAAHHGDPDFILPSGLAKNNVAACRVLEWQARRVTMLCFDLPGHHADIFVVNEGDLPGVSLDHSPTFYADNGETSAAWKQGNKIYLVATTLPISDLQQLL